MVEQTTSLKMKERAEQYSEKYREQVDSFERNSLKGRIGEIIEPFEINALGAQLDQYSHWEKEASETFGGLGSLGPIPTIGLDVVTASVGSSILPLVASIQGIGAREGYVYYKQVKSSQASGGFTKGQTIHDPLTLDSPGDGTFGSGQATDTVISALVANKKTYTSTLTSLPVIPNTIKISTSPSTYGFGLDDGNGKIIGQNLHGTVNYKTGAISLTIEPTPTAAVATVKFSAAYQTDVDRQSTVDTIEASLASKKIIAESWAVRAEMGTFSDFDFQQRFGRRGSDEVAQDLVNAITHTLNSKAIRQLKAGAKGSTNWNKRPPANVSYWDHKNTFIDDFRKSEGVISKNTGASTANRLICGYEAHYTIAALPDYKSAVSGSTQGAIAYTGTYKGMPVIQAIDVLDDAEILVMNAPNEQFLAPLAYSPYMPLFLTDTVASPNNPFQSARAAGVWAGFTGLNTSLVTTLNITDTAR